MPRYQNIFELYGTTSILDTGNYVHIIGEKQYEYSNHLGNVLATTSDKLIAKDWNNDNTVDSYKAEILSATDYTPFGVAMDGRTFNSTLSRHGFNGQEKDNEIYSDGNMTTAEFWQYDARLGRRWNIEPIIHLFPSNSSYLVFSNMPIYYRDPNGDKIKVTELNEEEREQFRNDMQTTTGYKLEYQTVGDDIFLVKTKVLEGETEYSGGSATAREMFDKSYLSTEIITIRSEKEDKNTGFGSAQGNIITLDFNDINKTEAYGGLDISTFSSAMVFFHEIQHTKIYNYASDNLQSKDAKDRLYFSPIDTKVNKIREELGQQYGTRMHYYFVGPKPPKYDEVK